MKTIISLFSIYVVNASIFSQATIIEGDTLDVDWEYSFGNCDCVECELLYPCDTAIMSITISNNVITCSSDGGFNSYFIIQAKSEINNAISLCDEEELRASNYIFETFSFSRDNDDNIQVGELAIIQMTLLVNGLAKFEGLEDWYTGTYVSESYLGEIIKVSEDCSRYDGEY